MSKNDRLRIVDPCSTDWNRMRGNEKIRYCEECRRYVRDFSKMPRGEVEALIASSPGRICARLTYNEDDSVVFLNTPVQIQSRRASPLATAIIAAIMGLNIAAPMATTTFAAIPYAAQSGANAKQKRTDGATASLVLFVHDAKNDPIEGATIMLINERTGEAHTTASFSDGRYRFSNLQAGRYTINIQAEHFSSHSQERINVQEGQEQRLDVNMATEIVVMGGMSMPVHPLRALYEESHLIAIAQAGKSEEAQTDQYGSTMKTELFISESLKGERKPEVFVYHHVYRNDQDILLPGERLLVFLKHRMPEKGKPEASGYELIDHRYGIKKLPDSDLQVYKDRIRELADILDADKPDPAAIVEWLVRCAENPATRWEGTSELSWSLDDIDEEEPEEEASEASDSDEAEEEVVDIETQEDSSSDEEESEPQYAAMLTREQKDRLTSALLGIETLSNDDIPLVSLVSRLDSERVIPFLLAQLRKQQDNPPYWAGPIMNSLAEILKDEKISKLAETYEKSATYEDVEDEEESKEKVSGEKDEDKILLAAARLHLHMIARQQRSRMLQWFLGECDNKIKK